MKWGRQGKWSDCGGDRELVGRTVHDTYGVDAEKLYSTLMELFTRHRRCRQDIHDPRHDAPRSRLVYHGGRPKDTDVHRPPRHGHLHINSILQKCQLNQDTFD